MPDTVTISHTNEGIRIAYSWNAAASRVFSNPVYLAEAYGLAISAAHAVKHDLAIHGTTQLNNLEDLINSEAEQNLADVLRPALKELRETLNQAVRNLVAD